MSQSSQSSAYDIVTAVVAVGQGTRQTGGRWSRVNASRDRDDRATGKAKLPAVSGDRGSSSGNVSIGNRAGLDQEGLASGLPEKVFDSRTPSQYSRSYVQTRGQAHSPIVLNGRGPRSLPARCYGLDRRSIAAGLKRSRCRSARSCSSTVRPSGVTFAMICEPSCSAISITPCRCSSRSASALAGML
jgi:hypothetical protein